MEYAKLEHFPQLVVLRFTQQPLHVRTCQQTNHRCPVGGMLFTQAQTIGIRKGFNRELPVALLMVQS